MPAWIEVHTSVNVASLVPRPLEDFFFKKVTNHEQGGETTSSTRLPRQSKKPKTRRFEVSFSQLQRKYTSIGIETKRRYLLSLCRSI
jgi:hypothetical protein